MSLGKQLRVPAQNRVLLLHLCSALYLLPRPAAAAAAAADLGIELLLVVWIKGMQMGRE